MMAAALCRAGGLVGKPAMLATARTLAKQSIVISIAAWLM
jgi:hypothetical protein